MAKMLNVTGKEIIKWFPSTGLGQADVTQPGSIKTAGVHISLTNPLFSPSHGILGFFSFAVGVYYFTER